MPELNDQETNPANQIMQDAITEARREELKNLILMLNDLKVKASAWIQQMTNVVEIKQVEEPKKNGTGATDSKAPKKELKDDSKAKNAPKDDATQETTPAASKMMSPVVATRAPDLDLDDEIEDVRSVAPSPSAPPEDPPSYDKAVEKNSRKQKKGGFSFGKKGKFQSRKVKMI